MNEKNFREIYPVVIEQNLVWGDMDAFGHLNNVAYFRLFETARIKYFENLKVLEDMQTNGIGPILHSTNCRYRYPLTYPDSLLLGARIIELGEDRFEMEHGVYSSRHECLAAQGKGLIVMVDYKKGGKVKIPKNLLEQIAKTQGCVLEELKSKS